jgi:hypothetical protein
MHRHLVVRNLPSWGLLFSGRIVPAGIAVVLAMCPATHAACPSVCVVPSCGFDTLVVASSSFERAFRIHNCGVAETFAYNVTDAQGWVTPVGGVAVLDAGEASDLVHYNVQAPPLPSGCVIENVVTVRVWPMSCPGEFFDCATSIFVHDVPDALPARTWSTATRIATMAMTGDLNGDGIGDVVIGTLQTGVEDPGQALVYFGSPLADTVADLVLGGVAKLDAFGVAVLGEDVNADGHADLVVSASGSDAAGPDFGRVSLYWGGPGFDAVADLYLLGQVPSGVFGSELAAVGDVNADGFRDLAVLARDIGNGRVYLYFGGPAFDAVADLQIDSPNSLRLGQIAGDADLNGDGWGDLCVAGNNSATSENGVFVFFGGPALDAVADLQLASNVPGGGALLCADLNGDGWDDVAFGRSDGRQPGTGGQLAIYYGGPALDPVEDLVLSTGIYEWFGSEAAMLGDFHGTGSPMLAVGSAEARVWLYRTGAQLDGECDGVLRPADADRMAGGRDVTGDGYGDLLVAAQWNNAQIYTGMGELPTDVALPNVDATGPGSTRLLGAIDVGSGLTRIEYTLASAADVQLDIFDVRGRRVCALPRVHTPAGNHTILWSHVDGAGNGVARGVYIVRLRAAGALDARKTLVQSR